MFRNRPALILTRWIVLAIFLGQIGTSVRSATAADLTAVDEFRARRPLFERHLTVAERSADLAPELINAILRIEGIFDPTRQGVFGPALRMKIRAGTASMTDVFGEHWRRADTDPNVHARVAYLAQEWLKPAARVCADFWRFRPQDIAAGLDMLAPADCERLMRRRVGYDAHEIVVIERQATVLPVFAAPYPGSRFSPEALQAVVKAHLRAVRAGAWWSGEAR